jgi:hypothetical protein
VSGIVTSPVSESLSVCESCGFGVPSSFFGLGGVEGRPELAELLAGEYAVAAAFLSRLLDAKCGVGGDPVALERKS